MNAHFVLRIATDRDWAADVRAQSFWLEETNRIGKCNHYMYRGEAVFFARFDGNRHPTHRSQANITYNHRG